jgi:hypothetical protein
MGIAHLRGNSSFVIWFVGKHGGTHYLNIPVFTIFINYIFSFICFYGRIIIVMSFPHFAARVKTALEELRGRLRSAADRLVEKIPPEKRRLVLTASLGFCAVFVLVIAGASLAKGGDKGRESASAPPPVRQGTIPPDDLFLPDEPDFVPGILLEREQRAVWTADDAAPLWQDPLRNGEEPWRDRVERTIDEIMESVP